MNKYFIILVIFMIDSYVFSQETNNIEIENIVEREKYGIIFSVPFNFKFEDVYYFKSSQTPLFFSPYYLNNFNYKYDLFKKFTFYTGKNDLIDFNNNSDSWLEGLLIFIGYMLMGLVP